MKIRIFLIIIIVFATMVSCKKCYICQAKKENIDEMIDFDKSCGSDDDKKKMEDAFKEKYKATDGYTVQCH